MTRQLSGRDGCLRQTRAAIGPYNIELDGESVGTAEHPQRRVHRTLPLAPTMTRGHPLASRCRLPRPTRSSRPQRSQPIPPPRRRTAVGPPRLGRPQRLNCAFPRAERCAPRNRSTLEGAAGERERDGRRRPPANLPFSAAPRQSTFAPCRRRPHRRSRSQMVNRPTRWDSEVSTSANFARRPGSRPRWPSRCRW